jgi:AcrR family transcriptional regulator
MDEIAARADITKPVVYAYFGSKEGLYVAYVERNGQELLARMRATALAGTDPELRLRAGILEFLAFVAERREGWQVLYAEATARGGPLAGELADLRSRIATLIRRAIAESVVAAGQGRPRAPALDAFAHAFVGAGESLANWWLEHPDVEAETVADWLAALGRAGVAQVIAPAP